MVSFVSLLPLLIKYFSFLLCYRDTCAACLGCRCVYTERRVSILRCQRSIIPHHKPD